MYWTGSEERIAYLAFAQSSMKNSTPITVQGPAGLRAGICMTDSRTEISMTLRGTRMAGNSNQSQRNSLANHKRRAAGRDPDREKISPVGGAFGRYGNADEVLGAEGSNGKPARTRKRKTEASGLFQ